MSGSTALPLRIDKTRRRTDSRERAWLFSTATVAPITTTIPGAPSEVALKEDDGMTKPCAVNLHNTITIAQQRLGKRVSKLSRSGCARSVPRYASR
jgi:mRNA-degrading endonuclease toxin of MazEF toxin-antitoxin module